MRRMILAIAIALCLASAGEVGALEAAKPSQLVNLNNFPGHPCTCETAMNGASLVDNRSKPDGTSAAFSIPARQVLVLTGMTWFGSATAGTASFMSLCLGNNEIWFDTAVAGSNGTIGRSLVLPDIVIKSGQTVCAGGPSGSETLLSGFLTRDN